MRITTHAIQRYKQRVEWDNDGAIISLLLTTVSNGFDKLVVESDKGGYEFAISGVSKRGKKFYLILNDSDDVVTVLDKYQFENTRMKDVLKV